MAITACIIGSIFGMIGACMGLYGFGFSVWDALGFYVAAGALSGMLPLVLTALTALPQALRGAHAPDSL